MAVLKKKITNRIRILRALVVVLLAIYALNLFSMQILRKQLFTSEAERISLQSTRIPAPRGEIYDRTGRVVLAGNIEAYSVYITPSELPATKRESVILLLSKLLNISAEDIESKLPTGRLDFVWPSGGCQERQPVGNKRNCCAHR